MPLYAYWHESFCQARRSTVIAQRQGRLHYSLQGYSVYPDCDRIALVYLELDVLANLKSESLRSSGILRQAGAQTYCLFCGVELSADDLYGVP